jgi:titin
MTSSKLAVAALGLWLAACSPASTGKGAVDLAASEVTDRTVTLTWKDSAIGESRFSVERSELSETSGYNEVGTVGASGVTFLDQSVQPSKTYFYRITALYPDGSKISSAAVRVTTMIAAVIPYPPTMAMAAATSMSDIDITWTDNSSNELGFEIERGSDMAGPFTHLTTTAANVVKFTDTGLTKSTKYWYHVRSENTAGGSTFTLPVSATTFITNDMAAPSVPSNVVATPVSTSSIQVTWTASTDTESGIASYSITRNNSEVGTATAPDTTFTATLLGSGAMYCYQVIAIDNVGNKSAPSTPASCATTPTTQLGPNPPTNPDAGPIAQTAITVTWVDNSNNEIGFLVERGPTDGGGFTQLNKTDGGTPTTLPNATSFQVTGLTANTPYAFRVRAVGDGGFSSTSTQCSARTLP